MTVLIANDDLTVVGGPTSINVSMDFGGPGKRGSQVFISSGNPNEVSIGQTPEVLDLCINSLNSDSEYRYIYQYQNLGAVNQWVPLFSLVPDTFSENTSKLFVEGVAQINIPVFNITSTENLTFANFNVQCSIIEDSPVSLSVSVQEIDIVDDIQVLPITVNAAKFSDDTWSLLEGSKTVHLSITVV
jgi:hypothetical protein